MRICCQRNRSGRRGHTLVELIAVISVNSVLMALAAGLLATLLRADSRGQRYFERSSAIARLADRLRGDVATARGAMIVPGEQSHTSLSNALRLQGDVDRTIEFSRDGDRVRRIEYQGASVVRREAYTLADLSEAEFLLSEARIVSLQLKFAHDRWNIEARLARDWRWAEEEK